MSRRKISYHERARRYAVALMVTALLPAAALLVFVLVTQAADEEQHRRLTLYHLGTQSHAREALANLERLEAAYAADVSAEDTPVTSVEFILGESIEQILRLQEEWGAPRYAILTERLRRGWGEMVAGRYGRATTPEAFEAACRTLAVTLRQVERLHEYESAAAIDQLRAGAGRQIGVLAGFGLIVLGLTAVIAVRIMVLIRSALVRQEALEQTIREGYEREAHAQRVEALGRLVGGVAHDFNNLLTGIIGHAELLKLEMEPGSRQMDDLRHVLDSALRAAAITEQLLTYSRQQPRAAGVVDPNQVLLGSETLIREMLGPHVRLQLRLDSGVGSVLVDHTQLQQVITNLCINARDAMPKGGSVVIATRNEVTRADSQHVGVPEEPFTVITVTDGGSGIHRSLHQVIFDPFFTTKPAGQGTGLGLSLVHGFVQNAGGHVELQSEPGKGTTFSIYLPHAGEAAVADHTATEPEPNGTKSLASLRGSERLLVVEDEPSVRTFIRDTLAAHGYQVWTAANGPEGLELCRAHQGEFDLLVTDIVMPGMDGPELVRAAEPFLQGRPVVFVSGYLSDHAFLESLTQAGHLLLRKPFKIAELLGAVRYALGESQPGATTEVPSERGGRILV